MQRHSRNMYVTYTLRTSLHITVDFKPLYASGSGSCQRTSMWASIEIVSAGCPKRPPRVSADEPQERGSSRLLLAGGWCLQSGVEDCAKCWSAIASWPARVRLDNFPSSQHALLTHGWEDRLQSQITYVLVLREWGAAQLSYMMRIDLSDGNMVS